MDAIERQSGRARDDDGVSFDFEYEKRGRVPLLIY